jgi:hypothetical protein
LQYCVQDLGGGLFQYQFWLTVDNNDGTFQPGQGWRWFIWGDANGSPSPLTNWVGDPASLPVGPWTFYTSSGGGHNGPTFGDVLAYWQPPFQGATLTWRGTSTANLGQGDLLFSTLAGTLGGGVGANFEVARLLTDCNADFGACCLPDGSCTLANMGDCTAAGGIFRGNGMECGSANCPQPPTGACCLDVGCQVVTQAQCTARNGTYRGDNSPCSTANCAPPTAWQEDGDAGELPSAAQVVSGNGPLNAIYGSYSGALDRDMYQIRICNPSAFSASTVGHSTNDTALFLFDSTGHGITMDDDDPNGGTQSTITSQFIPAPGDYYLALSAKSNYPKGDQTADLIWALASFNVERRPDGPAAGEAIGSWNGAASNSGPGPYVITLTGSCFVGTQGSTCYANCDQSTGTPFLNINDFICFQGKFAAGDSYANCDLSTQPPILNINDFVCFQSQFAAGCSAP